MSRRGWRGLSPLPGMAEAPEVLWGEAVRWKPGPVFPMGHPGVLPLGPAVCPGTAGVGGCPVVAGGRRRREAGTAPAAGAERGGPASAASGPFPLPFPLPDCSGNAGWLLRPQLLSALWQQGLLGDPQTRRDRDRGVQECLHSHVDLGFLNISDFGFFPEMGGFHYRKRLQRLSTCSLSSWVLVAQDETPQSLQGHTGTWFHPE